MMPNDIWHRKTTIYSDTDSIVREERAQRRLLRIQQVRLQSKEIAHRVIEKSKALQKCEEKKEKERKENVLREWKKRRLDELKNELNHGLSTFGESYKAVNQDIAFLKVKQAKQDLNKQTARERGALAFQFELSGKEAVEQRKEASRSKREHLRSVENQRAKSVASLPPIIKVAPEVPPCKPEGKKIEVIDFSVPRSRRTVQFKTVPDDVVQKVDVETHKLNADEEAVRELKAKESKAKKAKSTADLAKWLGNAATARKALEKDYKALFSELKHLEKEELSCRPLGALSVDDITKLEKRHLNQKQLEKKQQTRCTIPKMSEDQNKPPSPQAMDFTDFPGTHFTAEEAGALGPNAHSLQTLLDSLAGESRRRLEEVVGEDYYYCSDDDFATPPHSPSNVCVESTSTVQVSGAASVTSEVSVSIRSGSKHKKKKKKKGKKHRDKPPQQQSFLSTNSTQYMSPPERLQEDNIAGYLANIEQEKEQLKRELESKKNAVDTTFFVRKLLDMSRDSVGNLPVSAESSIDQPMEVPSKKKKSSSSSSSGSYYSTISDSRDGLSNGQSSKSEDNSAYQEASTAYLSLNLLENKDPLEARVEPNPAASNILNLIGAPAEPLVRPMENLRLSTIIEADSSRASSTNANESQTLDIEAELIKRGLPLPPLTAAPTNMQHSLQTGAEYLRRMQQLPHFSDSSSSAENQLGHVFHSTPVDVTTDSSGKQFSKDDFGVSPIAPSSE